MYIYMFEGPVDRIVNLVLSALVVWFDIQVRLSANGARIFEL